MTAQRVAAVILASLTVASASEVAACAASGTDEGCTGQADETPLMQVRSLNKRGNYVPGGPTDGSSQGGGGGSGEGAPPYYNGAYWLMPQCFKKGTVRITAPGTYKLSQDIVFEPSYKKVNMSWSKVPHDSEEYPQLAGYFLGFFAAIAVEADNVVLDCQGYEIRMGDTFHKLQRFFAHVELGSSPFMNGQGPPQFASNLTTPVAPIFPNHTTIQNCRFGLSSHHAIHGNNNDYVKVYNVSAYDFEVAAIALNGASHVTISGVDAGPSLTKTFHAELSQSVFLDHIATTLMPQDAELNELQHTTKITLRGQEATVAHVLAQHRVELQKYVAYGTGPLTEMFGAGDQLPDGSAIYGLLLHRAGVAINDIGFCPDDGEDPHDKLEYNITLSYIKIHDLALKVEQVVVTNIDGKNVMGPGGDIFQVLKCMDESNCYAYVGNSFQDAQLAVGRLRTAAEEAGVDADKISFYFGSANVPKQVLKWAAGETTCAQTKKWFKRLSEGTGDSKFTCNGDAMSHVNKGAIGLRLGFQADISVRKVAIENIRNEGDLDAPPYCEVPAEIYKGLDVRGVSLAHMQDLNRLDVYQAAGTFHSKNKSRIFPVTGILQMRADDAKPDVAVN